VTEKELFNDPQTALNTVADRDDHNRIFRTMSLLGLMLGLPLVLFALLFSVLAFLANRFLAASTPDAVATILCVLAGGLLLIPVYQGRSAAAALQDPTRDLAATCATTRIAALRQAAFDQRDIAAAAKAQAIQNNPHIAERYWLARSLAHAKDPDTAAMLQSLADDPAPIVACQALRAMGERGDRQFIEEIIDRINRSSDWYIQLYGYRALRKLGWVQPQSPLLSY
jgi:HEAT repeat protein